MSRAGGVLCSFESSTQGPVGPESGSVTAGKGDSFVRAGLLSVFDIGMLDRCHWGKVIVMPVLITQEQVAAKTAERFRQQYGPAFGVYPWGDSGEVLKQLLALGPSPTVEQVEALCPGWTLISCDECGERVDQVVQIGQEPDYESSTACICWRCATNAVALFNLP